MFLVPGQNLFAQRSVHLIGLSARSASVFSSNEEEANEPAAAGPQPRRLRLLDDASSARCVQDPSVTEPESDVIGYVATIRDKIAPREGVFSQWRTRSLLLM